MKQQTIFIGLSLFACILVGGLVFVLLKSNPLFQTNPANTSPQIMATVNGVAITREMVAKEITVSRFNVNTPLPPLSGDDLSRAADEALNQLITRQIVLQAASRQNFVLDDTLIEGRVELLFGANGDKALDDALRQVGIARADLSWWVRELTTVEEFTVKVIMAGAAPETRQQVYNDWLNAQRAAADIKTYQQGQEQTLLALMGEPAPNFTLTNLTAQPVALSDYRGKVVLVNFWASWCPSCLSEMPDYEQIYQQYGGPAGDFVVLGVNLQESQSQVGAYSAGLGVTFPVLLDTDGTVTTRQYQVTGMPGSFIIDRQGVIFIATWGR
ncbi:MAG: redoxin domain-containing protein [Anaerolineales bacterium]|nr:redoxin domain-containing protein [Anaerolineales bacterium]